MQRRTYLKLRNWLFTPLLWAFCTLGLAAMLGVNVDWRVAAVVVLSHMAGDLIDMVFERRPVSGPKRWE